MLEPSTYAAMDSLSDGRHVEVRSLRKTDKADLLEAVGRSSAGSLYRRFFSPKRGFTEGELSYFVDVDFIKHVALVALLEEEGRPTIAGGGRYIVSGPGKAEIALTVVDEFQGLGIGAALVRHLVLLARAAGIEDLNAQVLSDNIAMLKVLDSIGLPMSVSREAGVINITLRLN